MNHIQYIILHMINSTVNTLLYCKHYYTKRRNLSYVSNVATTSKLSLLVFTVIVNLKCRQKVYNTYTLPPTY